MKVRLPLIPYEPNSRDGDGDGIVQKGTAWERPVNSKMLSESNEPIKTGQVSPYRNVNYRIVDAFNVDLKFIPSYGSDADFNPKDPRAVLEKIGYRPVGKMGLKAVGDYKMPSTRSKKQ